MSYIWSSKKQISYLIDVLLFLASINFFHYGQIFIGLICLVLFIDNKCKFKVNNKKIFIVLLLFAITFLVFSYKLGIYCIFGLFLPMAYYVGSNVNNCNEDNVKKIIYIIAFGMATYILLNFIYVLLLYKSEVMYHIWDYDIWLGQKISPTTISTSMVYIISISYYLLHYEKNKVFKLIGLFLFVFILFYDIKLGRRAPLLLTIIVHILGYVIDFLIYKNRAINKKLLIILSSITASAIIAFSILYIGDINGFRFTFSELTIIKKFNNYGLDPERIQILFESIKYMPSHLFGGQEISSILGIQIHDLWFDIYDYAGVLPFVFICIYTVFCIKDIIKLIRTKKASNSFKLLVISFSISVLLEMLIEPIMTGSSLLLICSVLVFACFEKLEY